MVRLPLALARAAAGAREGALAADHVARTLRVGPDIELEDLGRDIDRGADIRNVHDAGDAALDRRRAQDRVSLLARVAELLEIGDRVHAGAAVRDVGVEIILRAAFVDRNALEDEELRVVRLDGAR